MRGRDVHAGRLLQLELPMPQWHLHRVVPADHLHRCVSPRRPPATNARLTKLCQHPGAQSRTRGFNPDCGQCPAGYACNVTAFACTGTPVAHGARRSLAPHARGNGCGLRRPRRRRGTACPLNTFSATPGSLTCSACPPGTFTHTTGSSSCIGTARNLFVRVWWGGQGGGESSTGPRFRQLTWAGSFSHHGLSHRRQRVRRASTRAARSRAAVRDRGALGAATHGLTRRLRVRGRLACVLQTVHRTTLATCRAWSSARRARTTLPRSARAPRPFKTAAATLASRAPRPVPANVRRTRVLALPCPPGARG